jgi:hypothetical protein
VLSVLSLELPIEARKSWRSVQPKDAPRVEHLVDGVGLVTASAIGAPHERRSMVTKVVVYGARDGGGIVTLCDEETRAVRHARVRRHQDWA